MEESFRSLDELTLMDDYMFGAVMQDPRLAKPLVEFILDIHIKNIQYIEPQKSMKGEYAAKGVRLDLYVEDEFGAVYNVEVQTTRQHHLPRRMRYYQSTIDAHVLKPGADYMQLKDSYIIFICNYDPFGKERYLYRFENLCVGDPDLAFGDGTTKVIVNTRGRDGDISGELKEVIRYLDDGSVSGRYSRELEDAVQGVKTSEERRHEYNMMMLREQEIRSQAIAQGREEERVQNIKNVMRAMNCSARQAMDMLCISASEQPKYLKKLDVLPS